MLSREGGQDGQYGWAMVNGRSASRTEEDLDRLRRRVINVVGHELRTPVTTIRGLAELLGEGAKDQEVAAALVHEARRLEALLDQMLVASGVSTALPVDHAVPVPIASTVREAWAKLDQSTPIVIEGDREPPLAAMVGLAAFRQILFAVLDNAAAHGTPPVFVVVSTVGTQVRTTVANDGDVVPPEDLDLAFEPFWRGEQAVMARPGLGLGLPVAKALAEQAGGSLALAAGSGGGMVVTLELPAA
jgi:signal transduction histidine kinase